ncbi:MAG: PssD/Cps14F family polysaccharide biosynthesis glycosyltransferase [Alphaproteobacteria bacterium]
MKLCLVSSSGGHLFHMSLLSAFWSNYDRFWVASKKEDALHLLKDEQVYWAYYPTPRNVKNLIRNTFLAFKVLWRERPDVIVSAGSGVAVPFFYVGKLFGCRLVFIEVYDRIDSATMSGKLVHPITDLFVIQWEEQREFYPKGVLLGQLL